MAQALTEKGAEAAVQRIASQVSREQVEELEAREKQLYGDEDDVRDVLGSLQRQRSQEQYRKLLPGQVRRFIERAGPLMDIGFEGDLGGYFSLRPLKSGALDPLWPALEGYGAERRARLTLYPNLAEKGTLAVFVRPGEPIFDGLACHFYARFSQQACQGSVFVDPTAQQPYLFHLALIEVVRQADPDLQALSQQELLESRLVGLRQDEAGHVEQVPVEHLLLLRGGPGIYGPYVRFVALAKDLRDQAGIYAAESVARPRAEERRQALRKTLPERERFAQQGYDYQEAELAATRKRLRDRATGGDTWARNELARIKKRQRALVARRRAALAALEREPELITPGAVTFLAHVLVIPSDDPEDRKRYDAKVEAVAVQEARAYEEAHGAEVVDVSTAELARAAGLEDYPGFDLLSRRPDGEERAIEVKGRARVGDVELSENEWIKAGTVQCDYWLYVVYNCAMPRPRLWCIRDPARQGIGRPKGGWIIDEREIFSAAEP
jgi:hypothetical protein